MAEVDFEQNGTEYSCRTLKSNTVQDISGLNYEWAKSEDWSGEDISVQLRQSDDAAWVGWYAFGAGVQWCISGEIMPFSFGYSTDYCGKSWIHHAVVPSGKR